MNCFIGQTMILAVDAGMSEKTVRTAKKELVEAGLIEAVQIHFVDDAGKRSQKHITGYKIK